MKDKDFYWLALLVWLAPKATEFFWYVMFVIIAALWVLAEVKEYLKKRILKSGQPQEETP